MATAFSYETAQNGGLGVVRANVSNLRMIPGTMTFGSAYTAGGETLNLDRFFRKCMGVSIEPKGGYVFEYDKTTKKVTAHNVTADFWVAINPGEVASGAAADIEVEHTGFKVGDYLVMQPPADLEAGLVPITAWVTEAGKAKVRLYNPTAAAVTGATKAWNLLAVSPALREVHAGANLSTLGAINFVAFGI